MQLILGSSSKTRAEILQRRGIAFTVQVPDIDEKAFGNRDSQSPSEVALAISNAKCDAILRRISNNEGILLTCDQIVSYDNGAIVEIREKPISSEECKSFLSSYALHPAQTHSALVMIDLKTRRRLEGVTVARQYFKTIPDEMLDAIVDQGDIMHCAGGFIIDIEKRDGTEDSILGLPMELFDELLQKLKE